eukprot:1176820-Prorocentrum_minimum.AAC.10
MKAGATRAGREIQVEMTKMTCGHSLYQMHCVGNIPSLYGYVGWLQREYTLLKGLADGLVEARITHRKVHAMVEKCMQPYLGHESGTKVTPLTLVATKYPMPGVIPSS